MCEMPRKLQKMVKLLLFSGGGGGGCLLFDFIYNYYVWFSLNEEKCIECEEKGNIILDRFTRVCGCENGYKFDRGSGICRICH